MDSAECQVRVICTSPVPTDVEGLGVQAQGPAVVSPTGVLNDRGVLDGLKRVQGEFRLAGPYAQC